MILILQVDDAEVAGLTELLEPQLESEIAVQVVDLEHQPRVLKGGKLMSLWASVRDSWIVSAAVAPWSDARQT